MDANFSYLAESTSRLGIIGLIACIVIGSSTLVVVAACFVPRLDRRALKLLEEVMVLLHGKGMSAARLILVHVALPVLIVLGLIPGTAKRARQILRILDRERRR